MYTLDVQAARRLPRASGDRPLARQIKESLGKVAPRERG